MTHQTGSPVLVNQKGTNHTLRRIPLLEKTFDENWVQELIQYNPEVLPVDKIEHVFAPCIHLAREVNADGGYIDNLLISPLGYITIVETKLFRNNEARREVVGQIIDYAKTVAQWSYEELEQAVLNANNNLSEGSIYSAIKDLSTLNESEFIDQVSDNLKRGRFLLLIVGDGIRKNVEDMVDFLNTAPNMQFTLGLVALDTYQVAPTENIMVVPNLLMRTQEIERAVVRVENVSGANITVNVSTPVVEEASQSSARVSITRDDFFDSLTEAMPDQVDFAEQIIEDMQKMGFRIKWQGGGYAVFFVPNEAKPIEVNVFVVNKKGRWFTGYANDRYNKLGLPKGLVFDYREALANMFTGIETKEDEDRYWWERSKPTLAQLAEKYDAFKSLVNQHRNDVLKALK